MDHVVIRNLAALEASNQPGTVRNISRCSGFDGALSLRYPTVLAALARLQERGEVEVSGDTRHPRAVTAILNQQGKESLRTEDSESEELLSSVFDRLLSDCPGSRQAWEEAFLLCICRVFSQLGREYAAVLAMRKEPGDVVTEPYLMRLAQRVARDFDEIESTDLFAVVRRFFEERTPANERLIWYLAQGHFALRELRMGFAGGAVRPRLLAGRAFFLDTNVLFQIAIEGMPRYESMRLFLDACRDAGASVVIGQPTLEEFTASLQRQVGQARAILPKLPPSLATELSDPVYYAYEAASQRTNASLDEVLHQFENPRRVVRSVDGVRIQDDPWFDAVEQTREFARAVEEIRRVSGELRANPKSMRLARHDAKMLLFVRRENGEGREAIFVSLDSILPRCEIADKGSSPLVAPLDALLQWVCPSLGDVADEQTLAQVFAAALAARLFPWEEHLHLDHFAVLDDLGLDCFDLPEDDLRSCVRHLETILPATDPTTDAGKLTLMGELQRYLATPGKRYTRELSKERAKREDAEGKLAKVSSHKRENSLLRIGLSLSLLALSALLAELFAPGDTFWDRWTSLYGLVGLLAGAPWVHWLTTRKQSR